MAPSERELRRAFDQVLPKGRLKMEDMTEMPSPEEMARDGFILQAVGRLTDSVVWLKKFTATNQTVVAICNAATIIGAIGYTYDKVAPFKPLFIEIGDDISECARTATNWAQSEIQGATNYFRLTPPDDWPLPRNPVVVLVPGGTSGFSTSGEGPVITTTTTTPPPEEPGQSDDTDHDVVVLTSGSAIAPKPDDYLL